MKSLILYASKHGTTKTAAMELKKELKGDVEIFDVKDIKSVNLDDYDKLIFGGSIYVGQINKTLKEFCEKNIDKILKKEFALFICSKFEEEKVFESNFPKVLLDNSISNEFFGGELKFDRLNLFEKMITKAVKGEEYSKIKYETIKEFAIKVNG